MKDYFPDGEKIYSFYCFTCKITKWDNLHGYTMHKDCHDFLYPETKYLKPGIVLYRAENIW